MLLKSADALIEGIDKNIVSKSKKDVEAAKEAGVRSAFIDRLTLTRERILSMAEGLRQVASFDDPVGESYIYENA